MIKSRKNSRFSSGVFDDIKIYNRALTAAEIAAEWNLYADKIPTSDDLIAYWPFNDNANDASGNGNNGTVNGATLMADRFGNANSAYSFDGVDDEITVPTSSSLNLTSAITIAAWMRQDTARTSDMQIITGNSAGDYRLEIGGTSGRPQFVIESSNGIGMVSNPSIGDWQLIVATYDETTSAIYLDGVIDTTGGFIGDMSLGTGGLWIGSRDVAGFFQGAIDDIRIYNRVLTPAEIQVLYNEGN